jgi:lysophospholipase L1-like esterase
VAPRRARSTTPWARADAVAAATARRRRLAPWRIGALSVLGAALAVALGFFVTDTWRVSGPAGPTLVGKATPVRVQGDPGWACRPLTPGAPLRLWIGGDSLAGTLGPSLGTLTGDTGVVQPVFDPHVSSGLNDPGFFSWPQRATAQLSTDDPEVVVFIIGANDTMAPQPQPVDTNGTPLWRDRYAVLVQQMLDLLTANNRFVFWVGAPTLRDSTADAAVKQIDDVARGVVLAHRNAAYVDAYQLFGDTQGKYAAELPGPGGRLELVRSDDGIHFTQAGADLLARSIFGPLDGRCRLTAQAVPDAAKTPTLAPGAQLGPSPSSSGRPSGVPTTAPRSTPTVPPAPPTTAPRVTSTPPSSRGLVP